MRKRGQIEIQFNWIFVLAVGALILLFFTMIMLKHKSASEQTTNLLVSRDIRAIMAGSEVSKDTVNFLDLHNVALNFECNRYRVGSGKSENIEVMSVFAPSRIKDRMLTWTLAWETPYRATNFLYFTSRNVRYILVGNNNLALLVNRTMREEFNKEIIEESELNNLENKHDEQVRLVFFDAAVTMPTAFKKMRDSSVSALAVEGSSTKDKGEIEFFRKDGNAFASDGESYYLKLPSLMGAIFTDDIDVYKCAMENAFKKLRVVSKIYADKTEELQSHYAAKGDTACKNIHSTKYIESIMNAAKVFDRPQITSIDASSKLLEQQNRQAELNSCALIY
jgi:hypothetical protein